MTANAAAFTIPILSVCIVENVSVKCLITYVKVKCVLPHVAIISRPAYIRLGKPEPGASGLVHVNDVFFPVAVHVDPCRHKSCAPELIHGGYSHISDELTVTIHIKPVAATPFVSVLFIDPYAHFELVRRKSAVIKRLYDKVCLIFRLFLRYGIRIVINTNFQPCVNRSVDVIVEPTIKMPFPPAKTNNSKLYTRGSCHLPVYKSVVFRYIYSLHLYALFLLINPTKSCTADTPASSRFSMILSSSVDARYAMTI
nr:MAG TPA: hypothetical protein [Caudoviricetes sp.]